MRKGFTLIELLVAIGLFSVIVAIAVGGFARALRTQRQVAALIAAQSNASPVLEQMAREVRTGYLFCHGLDNTTPTCSSCSSANGLGGVCSDIRFINAQGEDVRYSLAGNTLEKNDQPITSDKVAIKYLTFVLFGNVEGDCWNPRITISMGVAPSSTDPAIQNNILNLQTTLSARTPDQGIVGYCKP